MSILPVRTAATSARRVFLRAPGRKAGRVLAHNDDIHFFQNIASKPERAFGIEHVRFGAVEDAHAEARFFTIFEIAEITFLCGAGNGRRMIGDRKDAQSAVFAARARSVAVSVVK